MTDASTSKRGPYAKTAARRTAIADAALEIIRTLGHQNLTTGEVARRAGVGERTLFYHFPTRDHVLVAALERIDELSTSEALTHYATSPPDEYLQRVIELLVESISGEPWKAALSIALSGHAQDPDHPAHEYFVRHYATAVAGFAELIRSRQAAGLAHPDLDAEGVSRRFVAVWEGLQAQWLVNPSFDLRKEIGGAFRQLSGQEVMEFRQALDALVTSAT